KRPPPPAARRRGLGRKSGMWVCARGLDPRGFFSKLPSAFGGRVHFFCGPKRNEPKKRAFLATSQAFSGWTIGIFRQGIHALAKNGAHPCAPPSGSPGITAVEPLSEAKAAAPTNVIPSEARDLRLKGSGQKIPRCARDDRIPSLDALGNP